MRSKQNKKEREEQDAIKNYKAIKEAQHNKIIAERESEVENRNEFLIDFYRRHTDPGNVVLGPKMEEQRRITQLQKRVPLDKDNSITFFVSVFVETIIK